MAIYKCSVCETEFDETNEGKKWEQLPGDWACHVCESGKSLLSSASQRNPEWGGTYQQARSPRK